VSFRAVSFHAEDFSRLALIGPAARKIRACAVRLAALVTSSCSCQKLQLHENEPVWYSALHVVDLNEECAKVADAFRKMVINRVRVRRFPVGCTLTYRHNVLK
jgi:hypothetical protein